MAYSIQHSMPRDVWALVREQHGVVSRAQLLALGFSAPAILHRVAKGRLHPVWRGVFAVGRPEVTRLGRWLAAVLASGPYSVLSHSDTAPLWEVRRNAREDIHISVTGSELWCSGNGVH